MTAANLNAATGEVIGTLHWTPAQKLAYVRNTYNGSMNEVTMRNIDFLDGIASIWLGITIKQFRAMPSTVREAYRKEAERKYGTITGQGTARATSVINLVGGSTFATQAFDFQQSSKGLTVVHANAELVVGLIPEWGNGTATSSQLNALNSAVKWMYSWSKNKTIEHAKAIRRERKIPIENVFSGMITHRKNGLTQGQTIRRLI